MPSGPIDDPALQPHLGAGPLRLLFAHTATVQRYLDVEAALARAEAGAGVIPAAAAQAITDAATVERLDLDRYAAEAAASLHPIVPLVDQLAASVADGWGEWVHFGATTQDIVDTARALQMRDALDHLESELRRLERAMAALAAEHRDTVMPGRSMLQHAVPVTFGYKAAVWASMVQRLIDALPELRTRTVVVQLGGAAGTLASLGPSGNDVRANLADELGLADPGISWHATRDRVAGVVIYLAQVCASLAKVGLDVTLLAQTEVGEARESGPGGSSTMPHKQNPVRSQILLVAARLTRHHAAAALEAVVSDHERGTGVWATEGWAVPEAFAVAGGALHHARELVDGLVVEPDRMAENLAITDGLIMSEAVVMRLAPQLGRHRAHRLVAQAAAAARNEGVSLREALASVGEVASVLDAAQLDEILDPARYLGAAHDMIDLVLGWPNRT